MAEMTREELEKNLERRKNEWDETLDAWLEGNWDNPKESDNKYIQSRTKGILQRYKNVKERLLKDPDNLDLAYDIKYFAYQTNAIDRIAKAYELSSKRIELEENIKDNKNKLSALENAGEGNTAEAQKIKRQIARSRAAVVPAREAQKAFNPKDRNAGKPNAAVAPTGPTGTPTVEPTGPAGPVAPVVTPEKKPTSTATGGKTTGTPAKKTTGTPDVTPAVDREALALEEAAKTDFTLPQTLFDNIPSLKLLLEKFVKTPGMTIDAFRKELRNDLWFKQNSGEIKTRYIQYYNFRDLQASGRAQGTTDYEMQIATIEANLKRRAVEIGSAAANDPAALRKAAENLYITNRSEDENFIDSFLAASIKPVAGMIGGKVTEGYSGQALGNYNKLVEAARDNGFQLSDIIPGGATERQVLQGIASGSIDINRVVADARKLAAQGQPQYVRDLLAQGYTLKQVLAPYRQTMANVLEIQDPEEISLNDPLLRSAISDKGDMNMYEFKKALRRDNRWQYTEQARTDVSNAALGVLRDFGFQG